MLTIRKFDDTDENRTVPLEKTVFEISDSRKRERGAGTKYSRKVCLNSVGAVKVVTGDKDCDFG